MLSMYNSSEYKLGTKISPINWFISLISFYAFQSTFTIQDLKTNYTHVEMLYAGYYEFRHTLAYNGGSYTQVRIAGDFLSSRKAA